VSADTSSRRKEIQHAHSHNWRSRPINPDQFNRLMNVWRSLRRSWPRTRAARGSVGISSRRSGGVTIDRVDDQDAAAALQLELGLSLGEFIDIDSKSCWIWIGHALNRGGTGASPIPDA